MTKKTGLWSLYIPGEFPGENGGPRTRHQSSRDVGCRFTQRTNIRYYLRAQRWKRWCVLTDVSFFNYPIPKKKGPSDDRKAVLGFGWDLGY